MKKLNKVDVLVGANYVGKATKIGGCLTTIGSLGLVLAKGISVKIPFVSSIVTAVGIATEEASQIAMERYYWSDDELEDFEEFDDEDDDFEDFEDLEETEVPTEEPSKEEAKEETKESEKDSKESSEA